jgi:hypothetical protein
LRGCDKRGYAGASAWPVEAGASKRNPPGKVKGPQHRACIGCNRPIDGSGQDQYPSRPEEIGDPGLLTSLRQPALPRSTRPLAAMCSGDRVSSQGQFASDGSTIATPRIASNSVDEMRVSSCDPAAWAHSNWRGTLPIRVRPASPRCVLSSRVASLALGVWCATRSSNYRRSDQ